MHPTKAARQGPALRGGCRTKEWPCRKATNARRPSQDRGRVRLPRGNRPLCWTDLIPAKIELLSISYNFAPAAGFARQPRPQAGAAAAPARSRRLSWPRSPVASAFEPAGVRPSLVLPRASSGHELGALDERFVARLSENSRGPTTSCTSMTRSRFCAGPFRSRDLRFGRLPRSWEVPPKRRCHFRTTARNSPTASRHSGRAPAAASLAKAIVRPAVRDARDRAAPSVPETYEQLDQGGWYVADGIGRGR